MYIDLANMTLEEVSKVTSLLQRARMGAYLEKIGTHAYLYAVPEGQHMNIFGDVLTEI